MANGVHNRKACTHKGNSRSPDVKTSVAIADDVGNDSRRDLILNLCCAAACGGFFRLMLLTAAAAAACRRKEIRNNNNNTV